jgi:hypothetical protein
MNTPNIALCGKIASGKSTVADILVERYGYVKLSLAAPLKKLAWMCALWLRGNKELDDVGDIIWKITGDTKLLAPVRNAALDNKHELMDWVEATWNINGYNDPIIKPRKFIQHVGTEIFRAADPDVWVKYLIKSLPTDGTPWCVDDCRMLNEAHTLRHQEAILIKCACESSIRDCRILDLYHSLDGNNHNSENNLDDFCLYDYIIDTSGLIGALTIKIEEMLNILWKT